MPVVKLVKKCLTLIKELLEVCGSEIFCCAHLCVQVRAKDKYAEDYYKTDLEKVIVLRVFAFGASCVFLVGLSSSWFIRLARRVLSIPHCPHYLDEYRRCMCTFLTQ